jgi:hypothetical protein
MTTKSNITPLLESLVDDNATYKFPVECISLELINLFITQIEFEYFVMKCYNKLKSEYGFAIAHIFMTSLEMKLDLQNIDVYNIPPEEYEVKIGDFMTFLEELYITRIEKTSPDGELLFAMI